MARSVLVAATFASAVAAVCADGAAASAQTCGAGAAESESECAALLQTHRARAAEPPRCHGTLTSCASQAACVVDAGDPSTATLTVFGMSPQQDSLDTEAEKLDSVTPPENFAPLLDGVDVRISEGGAEKIAWAMYRATRVAGITDRLPQDLQGVFWVKNGGAGVLVTYQYAAWHEEKSLQLTPFAPFSQAWAAGRPKAAFKDAGFTDGPEAAWNSLSHHVTTLTTLSKKFSSCQDGHERTKQPIVCALGKEDSLAYASMQFHTGGNLSYAFDMGNETTKVEAHLQKDAKCPEGNAWKLLLQKGTNFMCADQILHSVGLIRIIDAEGKKLERFDEFVKFMGDVPLMVWSGWADAASRTNHENLLTSDSELKSALLSLPILDC